MLPTSHQHSVPPVTPTPQPLPVELGYERFLAPELFFSPGMAVGPGPGTAGGQQGPGHGAGGPGSAMASGGAVSLPRVRRSAGRGRGGGMRRGGCGRLGGAVWGGCASAQPPSTASFRAMPCKYGSPGLQLAAAWPGLPCAAVLAKLALQLPASPAQPRLPPAVLQAVDDVIQSCPIDTRRALYGNIVLAGGSTMMRNFGRRLAADLTAATSRRLQPGATVGGGGTKY